MTVFAATCFLRISESDCKTSGMSRAEAAASGLRGLGPLHPIMRESLWLPKCGV